MRSLLCTLSCAALLVACAGATKPETTAWVLALEANHLATDGEVPSIPHFRIDGFKVLDATHLILYTGVRSSHLVTLRDDCIGLAGAARLGYSTSGGSLTRSDKIIPIAGDRSEPPCLVARIEALKAAAVPR